jgi:hypothetical protein
MFKGKQFFIKKMLAWMLGYVNWAWTMELQARKAQVLFVQYFNRHTGGISWKIGKKDY